ncbi:MAG: glycosyltransferase family 1 protein [Anaerolineales bacterium]|nr:glycosyltransferase family 1 protein [Anaerolineales bacterium]MCW5854701.1 glycosyltransferase family 1 protein [Anaerolineales bacterium]
MRIAFFTEVFLPKVDGIVVTLTHLLNYLKEQGHESIMFAPKGSVDSYANTEIFARMSVQVPLYPELRVALPVARVEKELIKFKPDIIHLVNPTSLGLAGLRAARKNHIPVVASYHTDVPGFARRWKLGFLAQPIYGYYRWVHNQADLNLTPSEFTLNQLKDKGFERLAVWSGGVDVERFQANNADPEMRLRLSGGEPEKPLIIFVSRLSREKRCDWLVPVAKQIPGVRIAIIGDGPDRPRLERLFAGTDTLFTGYLHGEELASAFASGDIFAFTGAEETYGNVVAEAMASGLPVVAPNSGGVIDLVEHGVTGLLYDPEDAQALLQSVVELATDLELAKRMGAAGQIKARKYAWELTLKQLLDVYSDVIEKSRELQA